MLTRCDGDGGTLYYAVFGGGESVYFWNRDAYTNGCSLWMQEGWRWEGGEIQRVEVILMLFV